MLLQGTRSPYSPSPGHVSGGEKDLDNWQWDYGHIPSITSLGFSGLCSSSSCCTSSGGDKVQCHLFGHSFFFLPFNVFLSRYASCLASHHLVALLPFGGLSAIHLCCAVHFLFRGCCFANTAHEKTGTMGRVPYEKNLGHPFITHRLQLALFGGGGGGTMGKGGDTDCRFSIEIELITSSSSPTTSTTVRWHVSSDCHRCSRILCCCVLCKYPNPRAVRPNHNNYGFIGGCQRTSNCLPRTCDWG